MGPRVLGNSPSNVESIARTLFLLLARSAGTTSLLCLTLSLSLWHPLALSLLSFQPYERNPVLPPSSPTSYLPTLSPGFRDARRCCKIPKSKEGCTPPALLPPGVSPFAPSPTHVPIPPSPAAHALSAASGDEGSDRGATFPTEVPKVKRPFLEIPGIFESPARRGRNNANGSTRANYLGILIISRPWKRNAAADAAVAVEGGPRETPSRWTFLRRGLVYAR